MSDESDEVDEMNEMRAVAGDCPTMDETVNMATTTKFMEQY